MNINGHLDLQGNLLKNVTLEPVETWPSEPKMGSLIFKDKRIYICLGLEDGTPVWLPMSNELNTFKYDQIVASDTWVINHKLETSSCIVQLLNTDNRAIESDEIVFGFNQVTVRFAEPQAGRAVLVIGSTEGLQRPLVAYEQAFTNSQQWVVNHLLGYDPIIRCFVGSAEVQPQAIYHAEDHSKSTVVFNSPVTGKARCI